MSPFEKGTGQIFLPVRVPHVTSVFAIYLYFPLPPNLCPCFHDTSCRDVRLAMRLHIQWVSSLVYSDQLRKDFSLLASRPPQAGIKGKLFLIWILSPCSKSVLQSEELRACSWKDPSPPYPLTLTFSHQPLSAKRPSAPGSLCPLFLFSSLHRYLSTAGSLSFARDNHDSLLGFVFVYSRHHILKCYIFYCLLFSAV